jgi:hypothetical protein
MSVSNSLVSAMINKALSGGTISHKHAAVLVHKGRRVTPIICNKVHSYSSGVQVHTLHAEFQMAVFHHVMHRAFRSNRKRHSYVFP